MPSTDWRSWFRRKGNIKLTANARELSLSTQDLILQYNAALNAYEGMQNILLAGHEDLLTDDADNRIGTALKDAAIGLSQAAEPEVTALGRVVRLMWTDPEYCWYPDHEACKRLTELASELQAARSEDARRRAAQVYTSRQA